MGLDNLTLDAIGGNWRDEDCRISEMIEKWQWAGCNIKRTEEMSKYKRVCVGVITPRSR